MRPRYAEMFLLGQTPCHLEGRGFQCFCWACVSYLLQQYHPQSKSQAQTLTFPITFYFQSSSQFLPCCVKVRFYPGFEMEIQGPETVEQIDFPVANCCWGGLLLSQLSAIAYSPGFASVSPCAGLYGTLLPRPLAEVIQSYIRSFSRVSEFTPQKLLKVCCPSRTWWLYTADWPLNSQKIYTNKKI